MDCFYALADIDDTVRHDAVVDLLYYLASSKKHGKGLPGLQKDYQANVAYTIKRLVRGLGSSRGCARQGFSLGLTELLRLTMKKSPEKFVVQDVQSVVDMIASENAVNGSQKGQEERDLLLAQVTGVSCVVRSGRVQEGDSVMRSLLRMVLDVAEKKVWIQQMCYETVALILDSNGTKDDSILFDEETFKIVVARMMSVATSRKVTEKVTKETGSASDSSSSSSDDSSDEEDDKIMGTTGLATAFDVTKCDPQQLQLALIIHQWCTNHNISHSDTRLGPLSSIARSKTFDNVVSMASPLRESARFATGVHAVWGHVIRRCASTSTVLKLWNEVVCHPAHGLLNTTHQRRVLAFRLFQFIFRSGDLVGDAEAPLLLQNTNFVRSLASHISQTDSHLHRESMRVSAVIRQSADESMTMRMSLVSALMSSDPLFDIHSAIRRKRKKRRRKNGKKNNDEEDDNEDSHTGSSDKGLVSTLLEGLDAPSVQTYVAQLRTEFLKEGVANKDQDQKKEKNEEENDDEEREILRRRMMSIELMYACAKNPSMPGHAEWSTSIHHFLFAQAFFRCTDTKKRNSAPNAALDGKQPSLPQSSPIRELCGQRTLSLLADLQSTSTETDEDTKGAKKSKKKKKETSSSSIIKTGVHAGCENLHALWTNFAKRKVRLSTSLTEEAIEARDKVQPILDAIRTLSTPSIHTPLESLVYLSELQLLFPSTQEDAVADLEELFKIITSMAPKKVVKKKKKSKKKKQEEPETDNENEPEPISILNDLLLSLLMRPHSPCQRLLRDASKNLYAALSASGMLNQRDCVSALAETFISNNLQVGDGNQDNGEDGDSEMSEIDDEDEFQPIDPKVAAQIKAKWAKDEAAALKAEAESGASGASGASSDEDEVMLTKKSDLAKVMGIGGNSKDSSGSSDSDSSDDERDPNDDTGLFGQTASEMMLNAFQLLSKKVQKDQAKSLQIDEANFKLRVADLLDVWVKRNASSSLVPTVLLLPIFQAITMLTSKTQKSLDAASSSSSSASIKTNSSRDVTLLELESALLARLKHIVTKRILGKGREYPRGEEASKHVSGGLDGFRIETMSTLESCVELVSTSGRDPEITQMATSAVVYCCRVLRGTTKEGEKNQDSNDWGLLEMNALSTILSDKVLKDYLQRKSTRITEDFICKLLTRAPLACSVLVPGLASALLYTTIDVDAEKDRQVAKKERADKAEQKKERKRQEEKKKRNGIATDAIENTETETETETQKQPSTGANTTKKRKRSDEDAIVSEWKCRSQFHRAASARLAVAALRSGAAREHVQTLTEALCASVKDVEQAHSAGVKVRADVVKSLVELSSAVSSHGKLNDQTDLLTELTSALEILSNVVKTAAGIKQRGQLSKSITKTTNRMNNMNQQSNGKSKSSKKKSSSKKSKKKQKTKA